MPSLLDAHIVPPAEAETIKDPQMLRIMQAKRMLATCGQHNVRPLLPLLLNLQGKPYSLKNHFAFEPLFNVELPQQLVLKTGRQCSKSTGVAAQGVILANCIPHFTTLFVTPLYEMIRRFSTNYVRPFIEHSPVRSLWSSSRTENSVLQRSFHNQSKMIFSFAFLDVNRIRGVAASKLVIDEAQDLDPAFFPIIKETLSASLDKFGLVQITGTPKTPENFLEANWSRSSKAEWIIRCSACGKYNIPAMDYDLDRMIGPWHEDIGPDRPGVICSSPRCGRPLNPRKGRWLHAHPSRRGDFDGYHVPQIIMPMHYASDRAWRILTRKREGFQNTSINVFYNEVCGESYGLGAKLVTSADLRAAAVLNENKVDVATKLLDSYDHRVLAIDWGGGGEDEISFTSYAVLGMVGSGQIHCIYGERSLTPMDHIGEARRAMRLMGLFRCGHLVHDYTGAGSLRETLIIQGGVPPERVIPISYIAAASGAIMRPVPPTHIHPRAYYRVDKSRSLLLTCNQIRAKQLLFFKYDHVDEDEAGLLHDFLALLEEKTDSKQARDIYRVFRDEKYRDDFAQAVNIGCCALWHMTRNWPNIAVVDRAAIDPELMSLLSPNDPDFDIPFQNDFFI